VYATLLKTKNWAFQKKAPSQRNLVALSCNERKYLALAAKKKAILLFQALLPCLRLPAGAFLA
jgi:hypothetical protein